MKILSNENLKWLLLYLFSGCIIAFTGEEEDFYEYQEDEFYGYAYEYEEEYDEDENSFTTEEAVRLSLVVVVSTAGIYMLYKAYASSSSSTTNPKQLKKIIPQYTKRKKTKLSKKQDSNSSTPVNSPISNPLNWSNAFDSNNEKDNPEKLNNSILDYAKQATENTMLGKLYQKKTYRKAKRSFGMMQKQLDNSPCKKVEILHMTKNDRKKPIQWTIINGTGLEFRAEYMPQDDRHRHPYKFYLKRDSKEYHITDYSYDNAVIAIFQIYGEDNRISFSFCDLKHNMRIKEVSKKIREYVLDEALAAQNDQKLFEEFVRSQPKDNLLKKFDYAKGKESPFVKNIIKKCRQQKRDYRYVEKSEFIIENLFRESGAQGQLPTDLINVIGKKMTVDPYTKLHYNSDKLAIFTQERAQEYPLEVKEEGGLFSIYLNNFGERVRGYPLTDESNVVLISNAKILPADKFVHANYCTLWSDDEYKYDKGDNKRDFRIA